MANPYREEHALFRKTVRDFATNELAPHVDQWEADHLFPDSVFKRAGELGILGAHYPEACGGGGGDFWMNMVTAEELPRCGAAGLTMGLLVQSSMATPILADLGSDEQIAEFLKPALSGDKIAALGVTEPGAGSDVAGLRTTARVDGDDYVINGSKTFITNGTRCDFVTALVRTDPDATKPHSAISVVIIPADAKGFSVSKTLEKAGNWCSDTAELFFEDLRIPKRYLVGEPGRGFSYLMQNFQSERLVACASALAASKRGLDRSIEFGRERVAFGKPIIRRDYWQQMFANLYTKYEAAVSLTYRAAEAYNDEKCVQKTAISLETTKLISMAKAFVGDVTAEIIDQAVQFHGGMGYLEEHWVARAWRDQRLIRIGGGTTEVMRYAIAKLLGF